MGLRSLELWRSSPWWQRRWRRARTSARATTTVGCSFISTKTRPTSGCGKSSFAIWLVESHDLWEALNDWLLEQPGRRREATAYWFRLPSTISDGRCPRLCSGRPIGVSHCSSSKLGVSSLATKWHHRVMRDLLRDALEQGIFSGTLRRIARQPDALEQLCRGCVRQGFAAWKGKSAGGNRCRWDLVDRRAKISAVPGVALVCGRRRRPASPGRSRSPSSIRPARRRKARPGRWSQPTSSASVLSARA